MMEYDSKTTGQTTTAVGFPGPYAWLRRMVSFGAGLTSVRYFNTTDYPHSGQDIISHLGRIWMLGGYPPNASPGSAAYQPNTLRYSRDCSNAQLPLNPNSWRDEVTNLLNQIDVGGRSSEWGVKLAIVDRSLVILKNNSIWVLYGDSPANFTLRKVVSDVGCVEPNSVYEADGGVYFLSQRGVEFFDGNKSYVISKQIAPLLEWYTQDPYNLSLNLSCQIGTVGEYLRVTLENRRVAGSRATFMYHRAAQGWTYFSGIGFDVAPYAFDHNLWISGDKVRDYSWVCRTGVRGNVRYIDCNAEVWYRRLTPKTTGFGSQLHRFVIDTNASDYSTTTGNDATAPVCWTVSARESTGDTVMDHKNIRAQARSGPGNTRFPTGRRTTIDEFKEAADFQLMVSFNNANATMLYGDIYDAALEWQETNQRRSTAPR
jgi:hypothetical protein